MAPGATRRGPAKVTGYLTRCRGGRHQLLVFRDPGHAAFGLVVPGGTVRSGEPLEAAMARELREEAGLPAPPRWTPLEPVSYVDRAGTPTLRHYFHGVPAACPDGWTHVVRSDDEDNGWLCFYFWADLDPQRLPALGGRLGDRLPDLVRLLSHA